MYSVKIVWKQGMRGTRPLLAGRGAIGPAAFPLLALLAAKKLGGWGVYQAAKKYGIPRVYRRLLEVNWCGCNAL